MWLTAMLSFFPPSYNAGNGAIIESVDDLAKEYIISHYDRSFSAFGDRPESLGWTPAGQLVRYEALLGIADSIEGSSILDFGCGKGDFRKFLRDRHIRVRYTGFDINRRLIALAKEKYPDAIFRVFDIEGDALTEDFDYIFLCGVFNLSAQGTDELIRFSLKTLFNHCKIGLAFNALSSYDPRKDFELHYVSPEAISAFAAEELSPSVTIMKDVIPYDFTMFVYRSKKPGTCR